MPTYTFKCNACQARHEVVMGMREYCEHPPQLVHCGQRMQRHFDRAPTLAMINEGHYQGLRAPDGTDISTRAKHRAYMKANGLTTMDDFKQTWAKQARERQDYLAGEDPERAQDIANAITKHGD
jgi:predicted nucleic acid-binding Zn ribbon protein